MIITPSKRFLYRNTLNTNVYRWAIELSTYRIKFEFIKGAKYTTADLL